MKALASSLLWLHSNMRTITLFTAGLHLLMYALHGNRRAPAGYGVLNSFNPDLWWNSYGRVIRPEPGWTSIWNVVTTLLVGFIETAIVLAIGYAITKGIEALLGDELKRPS